MELYVDVFKILPDSLLRYDIGRGFAVPAFWTNNPVDMWSDPNTEECGKNQGTNQPSELSSELC